MHTYQIILVRDDGEQRKLRVKWDTSAAIKLESGHGLNMIDEVAKYIGHELQVAIREWEEDTQKIDMGKLAKHINDPSNNECPDCGVCVHPKTLPVE